jgi:hypothetical protein
MNLLRRSCAPERRRPRRTAGASIVAAGALFSLLATGCGVAPYTPIPGVSGCNITPANAFWRSDARTMPVKSQSSTYIATAGSAKSLKADFGAGLWDGGPIGIPYDVVPGSQPKVTVTFDYDEDSDHVGYPIPANPHVEGGANASGDRHIIMVDKDNCRLYELWNAWPGPNGWSSGVTAGSGATWDMRSNAMRTATFTSADAAGLQILPGLVRYEEVASGKVLHAIRMTVPATQGAFVWPASHKAGSGGTGTMPMGTWLRLKASVDENTFDPAVRPIIVALKTYGGVIADNGSAWYMSGVPDDRWDNDKLATLGRIKGSDFEVVDAAGEKLANDSYQGRTAK